MRSFVVGVPIRGMQYYCVDAATRKEACEKANSHDADPIDFEVHKTGKAKVIRETTDADDALRKSLKSLEGNDNGG